MTKEEGKLFIANPYDDEHIALVQGFESRISYDLPVKVSDMLLQVRRSMSKEEYEEQLQKGNEVVLNLFLLQDGVLKDSCCVEANRDTRSCELDFMSPFVPSNHKTGERLLGLSTEFAESNLGMENIFLTMLNGGKEYETYLNGLGYTAVDTGAGRTDNPRSFVKTTEKVQESARMR